MLHMLNALAGWLLRQAHHSALFDDRHSARPIP